MNRNKLEAELDKYRAAVQIDERFMPPEGIPHGEQEAAVDRMLAYLREKTGHDVSVESYAEKRQLLQALLTVQTAEPMLPDWFHGVMDGLLQSELAKRPLIPAAALPRIADQFPNSSYAAAAQCALWRGDIATLQIDAIVNAANAQMLGCFVPFHNCIDNVIQMAAGPRLREDCQRIMQQQGGNEPTGWAKVTRAYNLPSDFVVHTVGPIVENGRLTATHRAQLADSYRSCLDLAARIPTIRSIAFCCISTGVFGFPQEAAAQIAIETVADWLHDNPNRVELVLFNVFQAKDHQIYSQLFSK